MLTVCDSHQSDFVMLQLRAESTGLTSPQGSSAGTTNEVTVLQAVNAITALRDSLGGTTSSSVENALTRTTSSFTGVTGRVDDAPDLFAADPTTSVAFTRIPKQVSCIVRKAGCVILIPDRNGS